MIRIQHSLFSRGAHVENEKQKTIVPALINRPAVLLFDEFTSTLDAASENIYSMLKEKSHASNVTLHTEKKVVLVLYCSLINIYTLSQLSTKLLR